MRIRTPARKDSKILQEIEKEVLGDLASIPGNLEGQLALFPEGNFIAEIEGSRENTSLAWEPAGLASAVLWDSSFEPDYGRIHGTYPHTHTPGGKTLFIHTIAVLKEHQNRGYGTALVGEELNLAALLALERVLTISHKKSVKFFERMGFSIVRPLPEFLPYHQDRFPEPMLMELITG